MNEYSKKILKVPTVTFVREQDQGKQPVLDVRNLGIDFGGLTAVDNFNITIGPTEISGLIGPNGAGKSTFLKAILGQRAYTGMIAFSEPGKRSHKPRIGYVPQSPAFDPSEPLSVADLFACCMSKRPAFLGISKAMDETVRVCLDRVHGVDLIHKRVGTLSGGELQRVLLALALEPMPNILILDEPLSGVDAEGMTTLMDMLDEIRKNYDLSILMTTHDFSMLPRYADQVVLMTIHSAKGLEFPYVFLIGMEEGVFPSEMSKYSEADLEEERRLAYVGITRAKKELYISNSVTRMLYGRTQRNEPSRFLREIEPEYIEETRSPVLEQRSRMGGWGSEYSDTVPGGASGYSGPSGYSRSSYGGGYGSGYSSGNRSGYLNREYNAGESRGFGSSYGGRSTASSGFGSRYGNSSTQPTARNSGFGSAYSDDNTTKRTVKQTTFTANSAVKPAASGAKHYEPGDIVEHKVFGRGTVLKVKPAAGDQIVEINFEKVGIKKTMANFAPLTKITEEE